MSNSGQQNNSSVRSFSIHADDFGNMQQITLGFCSKKQLFQRLPAGYRSPSSADSRHVNYWSA
jgi:hypothetical protein